MTEIFNHGYTDDAGLLTQTKRTQPLTTLDAPTYQLTTETTETET